MTARRIVSSSLRGTATPQALRTAVISEMKNYPGHEMKLHIYPKSKGDNMWFGCNQCTDETGDWHVHQEIRPSYPVAERRAALAAVGVVGGLMAAAIGLSGWVMIDSLRS